MAHPYIFVCGDDGWTWGFRSTAGHETSLLQYARGMILAEPRLQNGARINQQYVIDLKLRVDEQRFRYLTRMQLDAVCKKRRAVRSDLQAGIADGSAAQAGVPADIVIRLPASVVGSPPWYGNHYRDAMASSARDSPPHLFITCTANPTRPSAARPTTRCCFASTTPDGPR